MPIVCCCAARAVAYIALRPELSTEASLPDVSVLGVCSEDFTYSGIYYQEVGIGYEWIDDDSEKPRYQWFKYESEDGAYLVVDEQNRLRRFVNAYDVRNAETSPDDALSTDALIEKIAAITSELVMNSNAFSVNDEMTTIDTTKANVVFTRTISDYVYDAASIEFAQDGTVQKLQFEYCDVPADFTPTKMDAVLEDYIKETILPRYDGDTTEYEVTDRYFVTIGDTIYGAYSLSVTPDTPEGYTDAIGVLVYDK